LNGKKLLVALLKGIWIWGFAAWVYVVATVLDPVTTAYQFLALSEYVPIATNLVGVVCFAASFVAFVLWEDLK
jgi:hypothetical protein